MLFRRRFKLDKNAISKIYGCYVNGNREIISYIDASMGLMSQEEQEMYLGLLKKFLSGALGDTLQKDCSYDVVQSVHEQLRDRITEHTEVKIAVSPEYSYMIEARVIDGRKYILIPADEGVEINGIGVNIPDPQG